MVCCQQALKRTKKLGNTQFGLKLSVASPLHNQPQQKAEYSALSVEICPQNGPILSLKYFFELSLVLEISDIEIHFFSSPNNQFLVTGYDHVTVSSFLLLATSLSVIDTVSTGSEQKQGKVVNHRKQRRDNEAFLIEQQDTDFEGPDSKAHVPHSLILMLAAN